MQNDMPPLSPMSALQAATKAVPALRYAIGLVGVAAAVALIRGFLPDVGLIAMLPLLGGVAIAMVILVIFAATAGSPARSSVARVLLWAVCVLVIVFMLFTVTAVAFGWPPTWTRLILPKEAASAPLVPLNGDDPAGESANGMADVPASNLNPSGTSIQPAPEPTAPPVHHALLAKSERDELVQLLTMSQLGPNLLNTNLNSRVAATDARIVCLDRLAKNLFSASAGIPQSGQLPGLGQGGTAGAMMGAQIDAQSRAIQIAKVYLTNTNALPSLGAYQVQMMPAQLIDLYHDAGARAQAEDAFRPLLEANCS